MRSVAAGGVVLHWLVVFAAVLSLCSCDLVSPDDRIVEEGECCGLRIGMSQQEAIEALRKRGVASVTPDEIRISIARAGSIQGVHELDQSEGLCVDDGAGYGMWLSFDADGTLIDMELSPAAGAESFGIQKHQARRVVLSRLKDALLRNQRLYVTNCFPKARAARRIDLHGTSAEDASYLQSVNPQQEKCLRTLNAIEVWVVKNAPPSAKRCCVDHRGESSGACRREASRHFSPPHKFSDGSVRYVLAVRGTARRRC